VETSDVNINFEGRLYTQNNGIKYQTKSVPFYDPFYIGVADYVSFIEPLESLTDPTLTEGEASLLTKILSAKSDKSFTGAAFAEHYCILYPSSYGSLTSILDPNGFENLSSFTTFLFDYERADASIVEYRMYYLTNPTTQAADFTFTFKF